MIKQLQTNSFARALLASFALSALLFYHLWQQGGWLLVAFAPIFFVCLVWVIEKIVIGFMLSVLLAEWLDASNKTEKKSEKDDNVIDI